MPRFDLQPEKLESRQGGVGTGALMRNGFTEIDAEKEHWSWQRPALATGTAAPFSGQGQALLDFGGILFGVSSSTSWAIAIGTTRKFNMLAGQVDSGVFGYNHLGANNFGILAPATWNNVPIGALYADNGTAVGNGLWLYALASVAQAFIDRVRIGVATFSTAAAAYSGGGTTSWNWSGVFPISGVGSYSGSYA